MTVELSLAGRRILITGAVGGLGHAVARRAVECGARVALSDMSSESLNSLARELSDANVSVATLPGDLGDVSWARSLPQRAADALGGLDGFVSCSGAMQTTPFEEIEPDEWQRLIDINLTAVFHVTQRAANLMREGGSGAIVLLSSVAGRSGRPHAAHYSAAKTALLSVTKSAALAYAPSVRINAVCPGVFLTPMWDGIVADRERRFGAGAGREYLTQVTRAAALGRGGAPLELANVVSFLLSDLASYVTGQAINVDGGLEMD